MTEYQNNGSKSAREKMEERQKYTQTINCSDSEKKPFLVRYQETLYKDVIVWAKDSEEADDKAFDLAYNNKIAPDGDLDFDRWDVHLVHEVTPKEASIYMEFNKDSEKSMEK